MFMAIVKALGNTVSTTSKFDLVVTSYTPNAFGRLCGLTPRKTVKLIPAGHGPWTLNGEAMCSDKEYAITGNEKLYAGNTGSVEISNDWRPGGIVVRTMVFGFGQTSPLRSRITASGRVVDEGIESETLDLPALPA